MYFSSNISSIEVLKTEYKKLAFRYHPDKGGSSEEMSAINTEFDSRKRMLEHPTYHVDNYSTAFYEQHLLYNIYLDVYLALSRYKKDSLFRPFLSSIFSVDVVCSSIKNRTLNLVIKIDKKDIFKWGFKKNFQREYYLLRHFCFPNIVLTNKMIKYVKSSQLKKQKIATNLIFKYLKEKYNFNDIIIKFYV